MKEVQFLPGWVKHLARKVDKMTDIKCVPLGKWKMMRISMTKLLKWFIIGPLRVTSITGNIAHYHLELKAAEPGLLFFT